MDTSRSLLPVGAAAAVVGLLILLPVVLLTLNNQAQPAQAGCAPVGGATGGVPEQYRAAVDAAAAEAGVPAALVAAQIEAESGWNPTAVSPAGARGIAQFMPATWADYGAGADPFDPDAGIGALGRYLKDLRGQVGHLAQSEAQRLELVLAAYNAGPGAVLQHQGVPPYAETANYVQRITRAAQLDYSADCIPVGGQILGDLGTGQWTHPLPGGRLTSTFGARPCPAGVPSCTQYVTNHAGIDLAGGGTVVAPTDLVIRAAGDSMPGHEYMGTFVLATMTENPELNFQFHHCAPGTLRVATGDTVAVGTPLCTEGASGNASGTHLHFQITTPAAPGDVPSREHAVDPRPILAQKGIIL
ncbi:transglycosylase SLT domain-containing protein [Citricoccus sp. SGAir0253]|uniref:transglycosylase SLT domain-containing protein n=1 Tax=Citricoccus sp. SGAir0253 TaxID=2567881 RepID=UPI00143D7F63|nr:transglycosylase SLT domain-containing protein [Citricoccus sp. SGAir0253]